MAAKGSSDGPNREIKQNMSENKKPGDNQTIANDRISCSDCSAKDSSPMTIDQRGSSIPKRR